MARLGEAIVEIRADIGQFQAAMAAAQRQTQAFATRNNGLAASMGRPFQAAGAGLAAATRGLLAMAAPLVSGVVAAGALQLAESYKGLVNQLKVAGLQGQDLTKVYDALSASAQRNFAPIGSLVTLYGRASQSAKELGASQADLLNFTDNVAKALRVAGTSPEEASGALLQLSQLLGSARVQAEEFNSINEGARPILQAVAEGIKEAGGSVSKLKQLVNDGKVSNKAFFDAFQVGAVGLDKKLEGTATTVEGAFENLRTTVRTMVGRFDEGVGATAAFVTAIGEVEKAAHHLGEFLNDDKAGLPGFGRELDETIAKILRTAEEWGRLTGLANVGKPINKLLGTDTTGQDVLKPTPSVEMLEGQLEAVRKKRDELMRYQAGNSAWMSTIQRMGKEIDDLTARIEKLKSVQAGATSADTARSIITMTPVQDLPAFSIPTPKPAAQPKPPISLDNYPVVGAKETAKNSMSTSAKVRRSKSGFRTCRSRRAPSA